MLILNLDHFQCASENDNNYYGDVDTDDDGAEDDGSVWWNSDDRTRGDRENVRVSVRRKFYFFKFIFTRLCTEISCFVFDRGV